MSILTHSILFSLFILSYGFPQIFHEEASCDITVNFENKVNIFKLPQILKVKKNGVDVLAVICEPPKIPVLFHSTLCNSTCIFVEEKMQVIGGQYSNSQPFAIENVDDSEVILSLENPPKCNKNEYYSLKLKIIKADTLKLPRLDVEGECELEIQILNSNFEPKCTFLLPSKKLIDLRPLKGKQLSIPFEIGEYSITLCGSNKKCGSGISGCKIGQDSFSIASSQNIRTQYNLLSNTVSVVASFKDGNVKRKMEIELICNWKEMYLSNLIFLNKTKESNKFKFKVDSSFGCVKLPFNCTVRDESNHLTYDLNGLYRPNGYKIQLKEKYFLLNICGGLVMRGAPNKNSCTLEQSQICEVQGNQYINRGSSPIFEIIHTHDDNWLKLKLTNGDRCNANETYSTFIDLKCSEFNKEPTFTSQGECSTNLIWETRRACPKFEKSTRSCSLSTYFGNINLNELHEEKDLTQSFSLNRQLDFNICGNLHSNCSRSSAAIACLRKGTQETIVGYNSPLLSYVNGKLSLKYVGEKCSADYGNYTFTINLICSLSHETKKTEVKLQNQCSLVTEVHSVAACFQRRPLNCIYEDNNWRYDLNSLIGKENNYRLKDGNHKDITYVLNICASTINEDRVVSPLDAMVYMVNETEPRLWRKYVSLGKKAVPTVEDGRLLIHSKLGQMKDDHYLNSKIYFECSQANESLKFLGLKEGSTYEFLWRTNEACPKIKPGGSCRIGYGEDQMEISNDQIDVKLSSKLNYSVSLCNDDYEKCSGERCLKAKSTRKVVQNNRETTVQVDLNLPCNDESHINRLKFNINCDKHQEYMSVLKSGDVNNCEMTLNILTKSACATKHNRDLRIDVDDETPKEEDVKTEIIKNNKSDKFDEVDKKSQNNDVDRLVTNSNKDKQDVKENQENRDVTNSKQKVQFESQICSGINFKDVKLTQVAKKHKYILNFDGKSTKCDGKFCKNGHALVSYVEKCPAVEKNDTSIKMTYHLVNACEVRDNLTGTMSLKEYVVEIFLQRYDKSQAVLEENECSVVIAYGYEGLFKIESSNSAYVMILTIVLIVVSFALVGYFYKRKMSKKSDYDAMSDSHTNILKDHDHAKIS